MILQISLLISGLVLLLKGADFFVAGASSLAKRLSISPMVIGLTVVAFGTSAPELIVNIFAALEGEVNLTFGNIIGSNIHNTLLILGVAGIIYPLSTEKNTVWREIPFALIATISLIVLSNDAFFSSAESMVTRGDGIILLLFFTIFLTYVFGVARVSSQDDFKVSDHKPKRLALYIGLGLLGLVLGSRLIVTNGVLLAEALGVSERIIGLTIIAIGTSLPELTTSAVAAYKGESDIAIGNVVGSNIFNILFVMGITSVLRPLPFSAVLNFDLGVLLVATVLLFLIMFVGRIRIIGRIKASIFLLMWLTYMIYLFIA